VTRGMRSTAGGFTLVEVLVGLAVGGIVVLAGFATLGALHDRAEHATDATTAALRGATARATLVTWLASAQLQSGELGVRFQGLPADEAGLEWDEVTFPTRATTPMRTPTTAVRLYIDTDPATPERGLVAELSGHVADEPYRFEIAPEATGLRIRYLPPFGGTQEWTGSWVGENMLPRGVELQLLDDPAEPLPPILRMPIRVPLATLD
jgi:prepilin-type N-terminal cleavage/methylation domain-containing protein